MEAIAPVSVTTDPRPEAQSARARRGAQSTADARLGPRSTADARPGPRSTADPRIATQRPAPTSPHVGAAVAAIGSSLPAGVVSSAAIEARLGLAPNWIERRTGIRARHIARAGERLATHAAIAGERALANAGIDPCELDLVIAATTSADEILPNLSPLVARALGAKRAGAFDVGAACNGFLSALAAGSAMIESARARSVLVLGADFMSRVVDQSDRGTVAVFADGAGAAVLRATSQGSRIGPVMLGSEGDTEGIIRLGWERRALQMRGHETFKIAVSRLSQATLEATAAAGLELDEIDLFVYHQANGRILSAVAERLELPTDRVVDCIEELGNTSAATLPLALERSLAAGRLDNGDHVLLAAFGAGFVWGATVLEWGMPA